ncbi:hypothetical protein LY76DRAFT_586923 [Colletotrichum caudatum]|nr:hypothetical protein LY76DRAFT_586923 [Colletotrichum caudatum]
MSVILLSFLVVLSNRQQHGLALFIHSDCNLFLHLPDSLPTIRALCFSPTHASAKSVDAVRCFAFCHLPPPPNDTSRHSDPAGTIAKPANSDRRVTMGWRPRSPTNQTGSNDASLFAHGHGDGLKRALPINPTSSLYITIQPGNRPWALSTPTRRQHPNANPTGSATSYG